MSEKLTLPAMLELGHMTSRCWLKSCDAEIVVQRELARFRAPTLQGPVLVGGVSGVGSNWSSTGSSSSPWSRFKVGLC